MQIKGQYITNATTQPLPISFRGVKPFGYLQPGERFPVQVSGMETIQGRIFAITYPNGKDAKAVYIGVGLVNPDGTEISFVTSKNTPSTYIEPENPFLKYIKLGFYAFLAIAAAKVFEVVKKK